MVTTLRQIGARTPAGRLALLSTLLNRRSKPTTSVLMRYTLLVRVRYNWLCDLILCKDILRLLCCLSWWAFCANDKAVISILLIWTNKKVQSTSFIYHSLPPASVQDKARKFQIWHTGQTWWVWWTRELKKKVIRFFSSRNPDQKLQRPGRWALGSPSPMMKMNKLKNIFWLAKRIRFGFLWR